MKRIIKSLLAIAVLDFIVLWLWVYGMDPDVSSSLTVIVYVPFVFLINLGIMAGFNRAGNEPMANLFFINAFIASVMMFFLFLQGVSRNSRNTSEQFRFRKGDTVFVLDRWKSSDEFSLDYSLEPESSIRYVAGKYSGSAGDRTFAADSFRFRIVGNRVVGFRQPEDTIMLFEEGKLY